MPLLPYWKNANCIFEYLSYLIKVLLCQNEETLRANYERKCNERSSSDKIGSDPEKIEEIERTIRKISTRIRITLQVLHSISKKISEIRDEELWPQICELVQE